MTKGKILGMSMLNPFLQAKKGKEATAEYLRNGVCPKCLTTKLERKAYILDVGYIYQCSACKNIEVW